jgi:hypothetical protein
MKLVLDSIFATLEFWRNSGNSFLREALSKNAHGLAADVRDDAARMVGISEELLKIASARKKPRLDHVTGRGVASEST